MKKSALILLIGIIVTAFRFAAPFEGTIRYDVQMDGNLGMFSSMLPKYYLYSFKDGHVKMKSDAAMTGEVLLKNGDDQLYLINRSEKTVYTVDTKQSAKPGSYKITKINETEKIAGYVCRKYVLELKDQAMKQTVWATPEINVPKPKNAAGATTIGDLFADGIDGFPLKMIVNTSGFSMTVTATSVTPAKLPASEFELPAGFTVKPFELPSLFGN